MKKILRRLDSIHQKLLDVVSPLDSQQYSQSPAVGQWGVAEIVHHIYLVEQRATKELEAAIDRDPQRVSFLRRFIPTSIISVRLVHVKAPKAMNPLDAPVKEVALQNLNGVRAELKTLCANHGEDRLRNVIFNHPFLGQIDGLAAVSFIGYHEQRHYKQIREVLQKLAKTN